MDLSEDRGAESHLPNMSLWEHIVLGSYKEKRFKVTFECFSLKFLKTLNSFFYTKPTVFLIPLDVYFILIVNAWNVGEKK